MKAKQARELGERIAALVQDGQIAQAYTLLSPILAERTPFAMLRRIGGPVGAGPLKAVNPFLDRIAVDELVSNAAHDSRRFVPTFEALFKAHIAAEYVSFYR